MVILVISMVISVVIPVTPVSLAYTGRIQTCKEEKVCPMQDPNPLLASQEPYQLS